MLSNVFKYEADKDIKYKRLSAVTLKTVVFPSPKALLAPRINIDRTIEAALQIAKDLHKLKFITLGGLGTSQISTTVCINHYGTMFSVDESTTKDEALKSFSYEQRKVKRKQLGIHSIK